MLITCNQSCGAVLILLTAARLGPPQTCPHHGGEGESQKKGPGVLPERGWVMAASPSLPSRAAVWK